MPFSARMRTVRSLSVRARPIVSLESNPPTNPRASTAARRTSTVRCRAKHPMSPECTTARPCGGMPPNPDWPSTACRAAPGMADETHCSPNWLLDESRHGGATPYCSIVIGAGRDSQPKRPPGPRDAADPGSSAAARHRASRHTRQPRPFSRRPRPPAILALAVRRRFWLRYEDGQTQYARSRFRSPP